MKGLEYNSQGDDPELIAKVDIRVPAGKTLTNDGTQVNGGAVTNEGTVTNEGAVTNEALVTDEGGAIGASVLSGASIAGTLTRLDSGKTFLFNHADGGTYTLPALERNLRFDFKIMVVPTNGNQIVASAGAGSDINGGSVVNGAAVVADAEDYVNFIASTCLIGDQVSLFCDGTQWIVAGVSNFAGGITFT